MNTDARARKTKPLRSASKARKQLQNGKPRDDVGCLCVFPFFFLLTSFAAVRKKVTEAEPEPEPESQAPPTQDDDDDLYV